MELVLMTGLVLLASGVGTITGFGTSTIMVPVLVPYLGLTSTLLFVGIIHWFGNIWKLLLFRQGLRWRLIVRFAVTGVPATILAASLMVDAPEVTLSRVLGALLLAYVAFLFLKGRFALPQGPRTTLAGGALYGFTAGIFGIGGAIRGAFLAAYNLPKAVYIATTGAIIGLAIDSSRLVAYSLGGSMLDRSLWLGMLIFVPVSFFGAKIGERAVARIPQQRFRQVIAAFLAVVALKLLFAP
jgi:uncharacterized membrane protein YfcA